MKIITDEISKEELAEMSKRMFGNLVKINKLVKK